MAEKARFLTRGPIKKPIEVENQKDNLLPFPETSQKESVENKTDVMQPNEVKKQEEKAIEETTLLNSLDGPNLH